MPRCAKCGKAVRYKNISYEIWKYRDSFPEFYEKPLCNNCYDELFGARAIEMMCEHFKRMGLDTTVKSRERSVVGRSLWLHRIDTVIGSVGIADRNIQSVELERAKEERDALDGQYVLVTGYRCNYVVQGRWEDSTNKFSMSGKPVRKSFLNRQVIGFKWQSYKSEGEELAKMLNNDSELREHLVAQKQQSPISVWRYEKDKYVRISQEYFAREQPEKAFPTVETFEAYDRIAQHIRSIANVRV